MYQVKYIGVDGAEPEVGSVSVPGGGVQSVSSVSELFSERDMVDYYVFENDGIDMDEVKQFYRPGDNVGYISSSISDQNGNFSSSQMMSMTIAVQTSRISTINGIGLVFQGNCPKEIVVTVYISNTFIQSKRFYPDPDNLDFFCSLSQTGCTQISISFTQAMPYSFVKLDSLYFLTSQTLTDNFGISVIDEFDPISSDLSIGELTATLAQIRNLPYVPGKRLLLMDADGNLEGTYYITNAEKQLGDRYEITAQDSIGILASTPIGPISHCFDLALSWADYPTSYRPASTPAELLELIRAATGVTITLDPGINVDTLPSISGYIASTDCRTLLVNVLFCSGLVCKVLPDGSIFIFRLNEDSVDISIGDESILGEAELNRENGVGAVAYEREFYITNAGQQSADTVILDTSNPTQKKAYNASSNELVSMTFDTPKDAIMLWEESQDDYRIATDKDSCFFSVTDFSYKISDTSKLAYELRIWDNAQRKYSISEKISNDTNDIKTYKYALMPSIPFISDFLIYGTIRNDVHGEAILSRCVKRQKSIGTVSASVVCTGDLAGLGLGDFVTIRTSFGEYVRGIVTSVDTDYSAEDKVSDIEVTEWSREDE